MSKIRFVFVIGTLTLMVVGVGVAAAQDYPIKPIRVLTGTTGGGSDLVARTVAQGISGPLGQPVIVDNRASLQSAEAVSKAPPDGYNLLVTGSSFWIVPFLRKVPYDAVNDFSPISLLVREVTILVVHQALPVKSVKELVALAKARPGELNYASGAAGGPTHLATELFKSMLGVNIVSVPYKSTAPAVTGLLSGETQIMIVDVGLAAPHVKSGRLRALAVTTAQPSALAPGLPTIAASGVPGYEATAVTAISAPAKTPAAIINRLNQEVVRVFNQPEVKEQYLKAGVEIVASSPEQFAATIKSEMAKWGKVIKERGIKLD